jgi:hypothetical protein
MMENQRRIMLKPEFAGLYPELPVGQWLDALEAAMRRAERLWFEHGPAALMRGRLLSDEHFEFAGGRSRKNRQPRALERMADHHQQRRVG